MMVVMAEALPGWPRGAGGGDGGHAPHAERRGFDVRAVWDAARWAVNLFGDRRAVAQPPACAPPPEPPPRPLPPATPAPAQTALPSPEVCLADPQRRGCAGDAARDAGAGGPRPARSPESGATRVDAPPPPREQWVRTLGMGPLDPLVVRAAEWASGMPFESLVAYIGPGEAATRRMALELSLDLPPVPAMLDRAVQYLWCFMCAGMVVGRVAGMVRAARWRGSATGERGTGLMAETSALAREMAFATVGAAMLRFAVIWLLSGMILGDVFAAVEPATARLVATGGRLIASPVGEAAMALASGLGSGALKGFAGQLGWRGWFVSWLLTLLAPVLVAAGLVVCCCGFGGGGGALLGVSLARGVAAAASAAGGDGGSAAALRAGVAQAAATLGAAEGAPGRAAFAPPASTGTVAAADAKGRTQGGSATATTAVAGRRPTGGSAATAAPRAPTADAAAGRVGGAAAGAAVPGAPAARGGGGGGDGGDGDAGGAAQGGRAATAAKRPAGAAWGEAATLPPALVTRASVPEALAPALARLWRRAQEARGPAHAARTVGCLLADHGDLAARVAAAERAGVDAPAAAPGGGVGGGAATRDGARDGRTVTQRREQAFAKLRSGAINAALQALRVREPPAVPDAATVERLFPAPPAGREVGPQAPRTPGALREHLFGGDMLAWHAAVAAAMRRSPLGRAPGADGLRGEHFRALAACGDDGVAPVAASLAALADGADVAWSVTAVAVFLHKGVPPPRPPHTDVRPLCLQQGLASLMARVFTPHLRDAARPALAAAGQWALEADAPVRVARIAQSFVDAGWCLGEEDQANAFNCPYRDAIADAVRAAVPAALADFAVDRLAEGTLQSRDGRRRRRLRCGVMQGDGASAVVWCLWQGAALGRGVAAATVAGVRVLLMEPPGGGDGDAGAGEWETQACLREADAAFDGAGAQVVYLAYADDGKSLWRTATDYVVWRGAMSEAFGRDGASFKPAKARVLLATDIGAADRDALRSAGLGEDHWVGAVQALAAALPGSDDDLGTERFAPGGGDAEVLGVPVAATRTDLVDAAAAKVSAAAEALACVLEFGSPAAAVAAWRGGKNMVSKLSAVIRGLPAEVVSDPRVLGAAAAAEVALLCAVLGLGSAPGRASLTPPEGDRSPDAAWYRRARLPWWHGGLGWESVLDIFRPPRDDEPNYFHRRSGAERREHYVVLSDAIIEQLTADDSLEGQTRLRGFYDLRAGQQEGAAWLSKDPKGLLDPSRPPRVEAFCIARMLGLPVVRMLGKEGWWCPRAHAAAADGAGDDGGDGDGRQKRRTSGPQQLHDAVGGHYIDCVAVNGMKHDMGCDELARRLREALGCRVEVLREATPGPDGRPVTAAAGLPRPGDVVLRLGAADGSAIWLDLQVTSEMGFAIAALPAASQRSADRAHAQKTTHLARGQRRMTDGSRIKEGDVKAALGMAAMGGLAEKSYEALAAALRVAGARDMADGGDGARVTQALRGRIRDLLVLPMVRAVMLEQAKQALTLLDTALEQPPAPRKAPARRGRRARGQRPADAGGASTHGRSPAAASGACSSMADPAPTPGAVCARPRPRAASPTPRGGSDVSAGGRGDGSSAPGSDGDTGSTQCLSPCGPGDGGTTDDDAGAQSGDSGPDYGAPRSVPWHRRGHRSDDSRRDSRGRDGGGRSAGGVRGRRAGGRSASRRPSLTPGDPGAGAGGGDGLGGSARRRAARAAAPVGVQASDAAAAAMAAGWTVARPRICSYCGAPGHYRSTCPKKRLDDEERATRAAAGATAAAARAPSRAPARARSCGR